MRRSPLPKPGTLREDGYQYCGQGKLRSGRLYELWRSPAYMAKARFCANMQSARIAAKEKGLPFNLTAAYLQSIFPADGLCPILRTPMVRGSKHQGNNSPSLDRRVPELGYVIGNVGFVSNRINQLKGSCTLAELERLVAHIKGQST